MENDVLSFQTGSSNSFNPGIVQQLPTKDVKVEV